MKKILRLIIVCMFSLLMCINAESSPVMFSSDSDFYTWVTFYYKNPSSDMLANGISYFCQSQGYGKSYMNIVSFFVAILKDNAEMQKELFNKIFSLEGKLNERIFLIDVLWLINSSDSRNLLKQIEDVNKSDEIISKINAIKTRRPYDILVVPIISPQVLDMLWATFFATGDSKPVERIISVLSFSKSKDVSSRLIGEAAKWSLKSNALKHERVLEVCKNELNKSNLITNEIMASILKRDDEGNK